MQTKVEQIASALLAFETTDDPIHNLSRFLQADPNFLGVVLALTNLSQEKFLRILSAERFAEGDFGSEWGIQRVLRKLKADEAFARRVAELFIEGSRSRVLVRQVANFYLAQLSLPDQWHNIIQDEKLVHNVIRRKLAGEYYDRKGEFVEQLIRSELSRLTDSYGVAHSRGQVRLVGKEVDHALPDTHDPYVLIMTSVMETTSSSQTARANEQSTMYQALLNDNIRYGTRRIMINFVDGAGWLARRPDLRKLHAGCDYILNLETLDQLEAIVCHSLPERFFTRQPRPQIVEG